MNIDEYQNGGRALYADFAEAVAAILQAAVAEHGDLRLQNIQHRAKEEDSLRAKLVKAEAAADAAIGEIAKDVSGCRLLHKWGCTPLRAERHPTREFFGRLRSVEGALPRQ
jgi:hypothetical protein